MRRPWQSSSRILSSEHDLVESIGYGIWCNLVETIRGKNWECHEFSRYRRTVLISILETHYRQLSAIRLLWRSRYGIECSEKDLTNSADYGIWCSLGKTIRRENSECRVFFSLSPHHLVDRRNTLSITRLCVDSDSQVRVHYTRKRI